MRLATKLPLLAALLSLLSASAFGQVRLAGHVTGQLRGAARLGRVAAGERVDLSLAVKLDQGLLDQTLAQIYAQPLSSRRYLSPSEFARLFGLADKRQKLKDFARASGLTVDAASDDPNGAVVKVFGPAAAVEQAFGVQLNNYRGANGLVFRAHQTDPVIPAALAPHLGAVLGLSNASGILHPHLRLPSAARPAIGGAHGVGGGLSPADIKTVYGLTSGLDGTGQTIAIMELDGYAPSDITAYETAYSLPALAPTFKSVDGQQNLCGINQNQTCNSATYAGDSAGMIEVALDIELAIALAPKAAQVLVYTAPNTNQGVLDAYNQIALDGTAKTASTSWGEGEDLAGAALMNSENAIFQRLAAQGQAVFSAAGDNGAYDDPSAPTTLVVDDPSAQPYVTAVGGTSLSGTVGGAITETVWNSGGSTGGGVSSQWTLPSYQSGVSGLASTSKRNIPDVALNADPNASAYSIVVNGSNQLIGGTSAAAPLWAAFTTLINQNRANLGYATPLGFANTPIYQLAQGTSYASAFNDITSGNNNFYTAKSGYDNASGWGSLKADAFINDVNGLSAPGAAAFTTVGMSSVTANWSRAGQPVGTVFKAQISTDSFGTVNASSVTANSFALFTSLLPATTYFFRVQASSSGQNSAFTSLGSTATLPAMPTAFALGQVFTSSITLSWTGNNPAGTVYRVDYWQAVGSTSSFFTTSVTPTLGGLAEGATYTLTLGALNAGGSLAASGLLLSTTTIANPTSAPVVITSTGGSATIHPPPGVITLNVPAGALTQNAAVTLSLPACSLAAAPSAAGDLTPTSLCVQVNAGGVEPMGNTTISIGYNATVLPVGIDPKELVVARFDPVDNLWVPLPSSVDTVGQTVTGATSHWSLFQVMQNAPASSVSAAKAFPNPWRVSQGPASMTFSQLPAGARIRIYTLTGLIVKDLTADASGMASWDGTNESGRNVASGFYFAFAQGSGGNQTLKLAVQR